MFIGTAKHTKHTGLIRKKKIQQKIIGKFKIPYQSGTIQEQREWELRCPQSNGWSKPTRHIVYQLRPFVQPSHCYQGNHECSVAPVAYSGNLLHQPEIKCGCTEVGLQLKTT